jgi:hypothetical protein
MANFCDRLLRLKEEGMFLFFRRSNSMLLIGNILIPNDANALCSFVLYNCIVQVMSRTDAC